MTPYPHSPLDTSMQQVEAFLQDGPAIEIPEDFAARVMGNLPPSSSRPSAFHAITPVVGFRVLAGVIAGLLLVTLVCASGAARGSIVSQTMVWIAFGQLVLLVGVFGRLRLLLTR